MIHSWNMCFCSINGICAPGIFEGFCVDLGSCLFRDRYIYVITRRVTKRKTNSKELN